MTSVLLEQKGPIARIKLNRPEVRNAFNDEMIRELGEAFKKVEADPKARVVFLSGEGSTFCAGADLNWMKSFVGASREDNEKDAQKLADLLGHIDRCSKPVITLVQGAAMGGGVGLIAVSDIVIAAEETSFALSEAKLGLIPAVISPFVIAKMGSSAARRFFLTGEKFSLGDAMRYNLVHEESYADEMDARAVEIAKEVIGAGPEAIRSCKELIRTVQNGGDEVTRYTVKKIAELRVSPEGQEGIHAFLEKRKPSWYHS